MRYIAMRLRELLHQKFPEAPEDDVLKVIGNLLFFRYMNPAIVAPDAFDIIEMGMDKRILESEQRRNLGAIAKVLQHAAAEKLVNITNNQLIVTPPIFAHNHVCISLTNSTAGVNFIILLSTINYSLKERMQPLPQ